MKDSMTSEVRYRLVGITHSLSVVANIQTGILPLRHKWECHVFGINIVRQETGNTNSEQASVERSNMSVE